jgi:predicted nucleic acid-binding protein
MMKRQTFSLDTNIFIYYFAQHTQFGKAAKEIFENIVVGKIKAVTSIITLIEILSLKIPQKEINKLKELYLETPNLTTLDVNQTIGIEAARIRREYGYRLPDAIQLATSLYTKADVFLTNDLKLQNFPEIKVKLIS